MNFDKTNNNAVRQDFISSMEGLSISKPRRYNLFPQSGYNNRRGRNRSGVIQNFSYNGRRASFRGNMRARNARGSPRNQLIPFRQRRNFRFGGRGQRFGRVQGFRRGQEFKNRAFSNRRENQENNGNNRSNGKTENANQSSNAEKAKNREEEKRVCSKCNMTFQTFMEELQHNQECHLMQRKEFVCRYCRACFRGAKPITLHLREVHSPKENESGEKEQPPQPETSTVTKVPDDVPLFNCNFCPFAFKTANEAARHKSRCPVSQKMDVQFTFEYPGNEKLVFCCMFCARYVNVRHRMRKHYEVYHRFANITIIYKCFICGFTAKTLKEMSDHFATHPDSLVAEMNEKRQIVIPMSPVQRRRRKPDMIKLRYDVGQVLNGMVSSVSRSLRK